MSGDLSASILTWPWSLSLGGQTVDAQHLEVSATFVGSAVLACTEDLNVIPAGGAADLAPLARGAGSCLYELPQGRVGSAEVPLELRASGRGCHARWLVQLDGARCRFDDSSGSGERESVESIAVFDWWDAFDDLRTLGIDADHAIPWSKVEEWLGNQSRSSEPRRALIVEIEEAIGHSILDRVRHLRRILLRRRDLVPAHQIQQVDEECLRWYIRQPGETLAEKAGHRQEIMSVVRQETFDTLENRVLKDFLSRCDRACTRYLRRFEAEFSNSDRVKRVRRFQSICTGALALPEFEQVQRPRAGVLPNYVLQSDPRYRDIWVWYQALLRNQDSEEQIWNWQSRLWSDVVRLLLGAACQLHRSSRVVLTDSPAFVMAEGRLGARLLEHWAPGPFLVRHRLGSEKVLSVVDSRHALQHQMTADLFALGAHAYLIKEHVEVDRPAEILAVWALNGMATTREFDPVQVALSAGRALVNCRESMRERSSLGRLDGVVVTSQLGQGSETSLALQPQDGHTTRVAVLRFGSDPRGWQDAVVELGGQLESWL